MQNSPWTTQFKIEELRKYPILHKKYVFLCSIMVYACLSKVTRSKIAQITESLEINISTRWHEQIK